MGNVREERLVEVEKLAMYLVRWRPLFVRQVALAMWARRWDRGEAWVICTECRS